jgi:hypothetical protein
MHVLVRLSISERKVFANRTGLGVKVFAQEKNTESHFSPMRHLCNNALTPGLDPSSYTPSTSTRCPKFEASGISHIVPCPSVEGGLRRSHHIDCFSAPHTRGTLAMG